MSKNTERSELTREKLLPLMAAHVLDHGLGAASLRPLAKASGTSDRMLIYHFGTKDRLIADVLAHIADIYAQALDSAFGGEPPATRQDCLQRILEHTSDARMEPFLALWWEIVAGCVRGHSGYREAAEAIMDRLLEWLAAHMPSDDPDPEGGARYLLTLIEGTQMLEAIGRGDVARRGLVAAKL